MRGSVMPGLWLGPAVTFPVPLNPGAGILTSPVVEHAAEVDVTAGHRRSHGDVVSVSLLPLSAAGLVMSLFPRSAAGLASALTVPFIAWPGPRRERRTGAGVALR